MRKVVKEVARKVLNDECLGMVLLLITVFAIHFASIVLLG